MDEAETTLRCEQFEVYANSAGGITIKQERIDCDDVIAFHPAQIDVLISWLLRVRDEILAKDEQGVSDENVTATP